MGVDLQPGTASGGPMSGFLVKQDVHERGFRKKQDDHLSEFHPVHNDFLSEYHTPARGCVYIVPTDGSGQIPQAGRWLWANSTKWLFEWIPQTSWWLFQRVPQKNRGDFWLSAASVERSPPLVTVTRRVFTLATDSSGLVWHGLDHSGVRTLAAPSG